MTSTLSKIEALIADLAVSAAQENTSVESKIEAAKVLAPYYALLKKAQVSADEDSPDGLTMDGLQAELRGVQEGSNGGTVSRRRRRAGAE